MNVNFALVEAADIRSVYDVMILLLGCRIIQRLWAWKRRDVTPTRIRPSMSAQLQPAAARCATPQPARTGATNSGSGAGKVSPQVFPA